VTTPNEDSLPARVKFLLRDRLRMMDECGDITHITPIFWNLLVRHYLPAAGLRIRLAAVHPERGVIAGERAYRPMLRVLRPFTRRNPRLLGDNHILVLQR
jgi:hypothetical protein